MIGLLDAAAGWLGMTRRALTLTAALVVLALTAVTLAAAIWQDVQRHGGAAFLYALAISLLVQVAATLVLSPCHRCTGCGQVTR